MTANPYAPILTYEQAKQWCDNEFQQDDDFDVGIVHHLEGDKYQPVAAEDWMVDFYMMSRPQKLVAIRFYRHEKHPHWIEDLNKPHELE